MRILFHLQEKCEVSLENILTTCHNTHNKQIGSKTRLIQLINGGWGGGSGFQLSPHCNGKVSSLKTLEFRKLENPTFVYKLNPKT